MLTSPRFKWNEQLKAAANNAPALWPGARGSGVHLIQFALLDRGFDLPRSTGKVKSPDGIYGSETKAAIQEFQRQSAGCSNRKPPFAGCSLAAIRQVASSC